MSKCLYCNFKFKSEEMWWASLIIDEYGDEDNFWCCQKCAIKHGLDEGNGNEEHGDWVRPGEHRGF